MSASAAAKQKAKPAARSVPKAHLEEAYFNGEVVRLTAGPYSAGERTLVVGPWNMGPRVSPKPNDKRPNLYFVIPGSQHQVPDEPRYDNTMILSAAPDDPKEFDVYWAVVLDPALKPTPKDDFTDEKQLLLATQATFTPADDFTFAQIPSASFLESTLKMSSIEKLKKYRRADGSLPRVAIITAGFAVRLTVEKPEQKQADTAPAEH
jgi:hypothetical protein